MRVALVHDYLREYGGAERVVEALHEIFPEAPLYTAYYNPKGLGIHAKNFEGWDIRTSWLQKVPFANKMVSPFRIFAPSIFEGFDLSEYDVVISSSAIYFAKAVITKPGSLHISYIHTPPRYLYGYTTSFNYKKHWLTRIVGEVMNHFLRLYDFETSQRPDILVANSKNVEERIKKFYRRDSVVIYPPVDMEKIRNSKSEIRKEDYYLSIGRLTRGKGIEIAVVACSKLGVKLKVAGSGPELEKLKKLADDSVEFLGAVTDEEKIKLYAGAKALIVASEDEDFGITAVEAMACGTPVIAMRAGGYLETVIEGKTGEFFEAGTNALGFKDYYDPEVVENLKKVIANFDGTKYKSEELKKHAEKFSKERFRKEILGLIEENLKG
jgi:glycosyltransferase involved in cell wall biosynthesis